MITPSYANANELGYGFADPEKLKRGKKFKKPKKNLYLRWR